MMRMRPWRAAALGLWIACAGCGGEREAAPPSSEAAERLRKLQEEEGNVLARRAELSRERQAVDQQRAALDHRRQQAASSGGDVTAVDAELAALREREQKLLVDEAALGRKLDALLRDYGEVTVAGGARDTAAREAQLAVREKDLGRREAFLAQREATVAERERELLRREREACGPVVATAAPSARYGRKDVEPLLSSARRKMGEKGLLPSDLPSPARELEREAAAAMSSGDWSRARFAADQLVATVESLKVDKAFIVAKIGRLNGSVKAAKLPEDSRRQVDELFRDATADYGDGRFTAANVKLNRIYGLLR